MGQYRCIIIDDDDIDRLSVVMFAKRFPILDIAGVFRSAEEALPTLTKQPVDILFLDINMPGINGLEFRKKMSQVPVCIFISSHTDLAFETFALDTLDFIAKPVTLEKFTKTLGRIEEYLDIRHKAALFESTLGGDTISIKEGYEKTKIKLHNILYLEALKDYTKIVTAEKKHCVLASLGVLLKMPEFSSFLRIHRSYAVQKLFVEKVISNEIILKNKTVLPIGRSFKDEVKTLL